jgi:CheY-like chemotaxis protein
LRRIRRSDPERVRTPAIALSAFARREDADRSRLAGFELHLGKPVEPSQLQSQVARLTGRARFPSESPQGKMAGGRSKDRR